MARRAHKLTRIASGFILLGGGAAMLVLPGPGLLAIAGGLSLLAAEYRWAAKATDALRAAHLRLAGPS